VVADDPVARRRPVGAPGPPKRSKMFLDVGTARAVLTIASHPFSFQQSIAAIAGPFNRNSLIAGEIRQLPKRD
jgi:hypothetical protein